MAKTGMQKAQLEIFSINHVQPAVYTSFFKLTAILDSDSAKTDSFQSAFLIVSVSAPTIGFIFS